LIAHHRPKSTDVDAYVDTLESWVRSLVAAGVAPERITLVGFSRGAQLTARASSRLRTLGVGTALMGVCSEGDFVADPPVVLADPVLSIYETTDVVRSCAGLARRSGLKSFEEIAISTGKRHGAFYRPLPEWLVPLKAWIARTNPPSR
jgi:acetyl esterase/lipase